MILDVESVGLHGEGFAVGWTIVNDGVEIASAQYGCAPDLAAGAESDRQWVKDNCHTVVNCVSPRHVRDEFWRAWEYAKAQGAHLLADCAWPVEARFLSACVDDFPAERCWKGPYPLLDLAPIVHALGGNPAATQLREPNELPAHNPLADARQSSRLFIEAIKILSGAN